MTILRKLFGLALSLEALGISKRVQSSMFHGIAGHDDIKEIFKMAIGSNNPVHILLVGPPGTGKTMFLEKILDLFRRSSYFTLGSHSTKAGMINELFERRPKYLLIDEIEYMPTKDQTALLSLMQSGVLSETKIKKTRSTQLRTWVFATSNDTKKLSYALLSRFIVIELDKYSYEEFKEILLQLLVKTEQVEPELANVIVDEIHRNFENPNIRDAIKVGRIARNRNDVLLIMKRLKKQSYLQIATKENHEENE